LVIEEIYRAANIVHQMNQAHASERGAVGLDLGDGKDGKEMIDAPMLKQV
jgi:citrate lyase subunit beta-like protein